MRSSSAQSRFRVVVSFLVAIAFCYSAASSAISAEQAVAIEQAKFSRSTEDDETIPERFRLPIATVEVSLSNLRRFDAISTQRVTFESPVKTEHDVNNTVHCEYYQPHWKPGDETVPAVVVLHILGGDFELSRVCCRALSNQGIATLFLKMPYYGPRRPSGKRERMISEDPVKTVARVTQAVKDIRRAADWLESRDEVDSKRLGITGISLGGIVASLTASVEPRFKNSCLVLAGGDFATLFMESTELDDERDAWEGQAVTAQEVGAALKMIDPLTYASRLKGRNVLMMNGRKDTVIPRTCTDQLWELAGKPEIIWWNAGHHSSAIYLPSGLLKMVPFFKQ